MSSTLMDILTAAKKGVLRSSLRALIDVHLMKKSSKGRNDPDWGDQDVWHPSSVCGGICPRMEQIARISPKSCTPKEAPDARLMRIFDTGHAIHHWYQNFVFGPMGILWGVWKRGDEVRLGFQPAGDWVYHEFAVWSAAENIGGHCDGILFINGEWYVLEIKTINSRGFQALLEPNALHDRQLQMYLKCVLVLPKCAEGKLEMLDPPALTQGVFLYVNKDTSEEKEYWVQATPSVIEAILGNMRKTRQGLAAKSLVPRIAACKTATSKTVVDCRAGKACFSVGDGPKGYAELVTIRDEKAKAKS